MYILKKLIVLISILILSSTVFSQTDTGTLNSKKDTAHYKSLPIPVVKRIVKDLLSGDSCKLILNITNQELSETRKIVQLKDSIITDYKVKEINYQSEIYNYNQKWVTENLYSKKLALELNTEKYKNTLFSYFGGGTILILTCLLILK